MGLERAAWIQEKDGFESPVFRKKFIAKGIKSAEICICGLGWFELYINGQAVSEDVFEPAVSVYANVNNRFLCYPLQDVFCSPRIYYCKYDVAAFLKEGENLLSVHLGNGWFNQTRVLNEGSFYQGAPRLIFSLMIVHTDGRTEEIVSDTSVLAGRSEIIENNIYYGEKHDLHLKRDYHGNDFDERDFFPAVAAVSPEGRPTLSEYPKEKVAERIVPKLLGIYNGKKLYDVGKNISGRVKFDTQFGGRIIIEHAEELNEDKTLNFSTMGNKFIPWRTQTCEYIGDAIPHKGIYPHFSWQTFRYFTVEGEIENIVCEWIHSQMEIASSFESDNAVLNGLYDIFKRTELDNLHGCVPSDCPHRERFGYTGDGQVTCATVMTVFDARKIYKKWMQDIVDCQNKENGHVQHTAPFFGGGGGPGGWGVAVVMIPYQYYKIYGDASLVRKYLKNMLYYLEYMESRCEGEVVVREESGGWFTGDWAFEGCGPLGPEKELLLSPQYVNTYYLVKAYDMISELNERLNLGIDEISFKERRQKHCIALTEKFFDPKTGDFCRNALGANAFAVDLGLGNEATLKNLVSCYEKKGGFDTGIFATEVLIRVLSERGYGQLVFDLLSSKKKDMSFGYMLAKGATTLWEYWDGKESHCHPMFGGCVKTLFSHFLGIKNLSVGYADAEISPADIDGLNYVKGFIQTPYGSVFVELDKVKGNLNIVVPKNINAFVNFRGIRQILREGANHFDFADHQLG